ncbi:MAG: hypothetical protein HZC28_14405, partial [Spirochaetes bacterium]|nr:hypothetical protein [Spirochaetota bacterium]
SQSKALRSQSKALRSQSKALRSQSKALRSQSKAEIRFAIRSNEYALGYRLNEVTALYLAPVVSGRIRVTAEGVLSSAGVGLMAEYSWFGCGVIINGIVPLRDMDVVGYVFVRIIL